MALSLDETDVALLRELQIDADRSNVELARRIGLSPAATLHRVRRLKEAGVIAGVHARLDPAAAGFGLQVYIAATLSHHDDRANGRFATACAALPQVVEADWVTGETDALLHVVTRDIEDLQRVLQRLSGRGGASRLLTLLRLEQLKAPGPLPLT